MISRRCGSQQLKLGTDALPPTCSTGTAVALDVCRAATAAPTNWRSGKSLCRTARVPLAICRSPRGLQPRVGSPDDCCTPGTRQSMAMLPASRGEQSQVQVSDGCPSNPRIGTDPEVKSAVSNSASRNGQSTYAVCSGPCRPPCSAAPTSARGWSNCAATSRAPALANERVHTNAAEQVVLKLKTPLA